MDSFQPFLSNVPSDIVLPKVRIDVYKYDQPLYRLVWNDQLEDQKEVIITRTQTNLYVSDKKGFRNYCPTDNFFWKNKWYNLTIFHYPNGDTWYFNIAAPPKLTDQGLSYVDLDIDVVYKPNSQTIDVLDEEEFEENKKVFSYPSRIIESVGEAVEEIKTKIAKKQFEDILKL